MLNRVSTYLSNKKKHLFSQLSINKFRVTPAGLCCISISSQELIFIYASEVAGKITVELCESHSYTDKKNLFSILSDIIKSHSLKNLPCSLMLQPEDYQLIVTDPLPVPPAEFQSAIRWKIKDQLRFPLDDVAIDSFMMPKMKSNLSKIMVVAAQMSKLKMISDQINHCGLNLKYIDIPELGLRNINLLYDQKEKTTALIYVQENDIQLLITSEKQLYVTRVLKLNLNINDENSFAQGMERLASEALRSFDYYQSLWDKPSPSTIMFASVKLIEPQAIQVFAQKVKVPVEGVNLSDQLVYKQKITTQQQGKYFLVTGGALRQRTQNLQEINLATYLPKETGINLTPKVVLVSYGVFFALLLMFHSVLLWQKHKLETQFDQVNNQASVDQQQLGVLAQKYPISNLAELKKTIEQLQKEYEAKAKMIDLLSPNANFSSYLIGLSNAIVPGVWLTQISFDRGEDKILLRGFALQPTLLEQFYSRLGSQPAFSNLRFQVKEIKQTTYPSSFYIVARKVNIA